MVWAKPLRVGYFKVAPHTKPGPQAMPEGTAVAYFKLIARETQISDAHRTFDRRADQDPGLHPSPRAANVACQSNCK